MATFVELVRQGASIDALAAHLDALDHVTRLAQVRQQRPADQAALYERAAGRHTDIDFFVPARVGPGVAVIHHGWNTLPVIGGSFRKPMARHPDEQGALCGYNDNDGIVSHLGWFTGPGYFVLRRRGATPPDGRKDTDGQVFVNYFEQPARAPVVGWPAPKPAMALTAGLVWGGMCDYMWQVSAQVSIGAAFKDGKQIGQFFTLVRDDRGGAA